MCFVEHSSCWTPSEHCCFKICRQCSPTWTSLSLQNSALCLWCLHFRSDTTQGDPPPAPAPGLALQGCLISAPPRLLSVTADAPFAATSPVSRSPSAPQPASRQQPAAAAAPMVVPEVGFAKPAPAKSALNFACKTSVGKLPDDVGQKSGRRVSEGGGGRRTVKCVPPLEASMTDLQTSFARGSSGSSHGGGDISGAASGELAGTSPARRSHLARQQMGLPAVGDPAARRPLFFPA